MTGAEAKEFTQTLVKEIEEGILESRRHSDRMKAMAEQLEARLREVMLVREKVNELPDEVEIHVELPEAKTQYMKVAEFLLSGGNKPVTRRAITKGTGLSQSAVSQILHRTHRDNFVSATMAGYARKKLWFLTGRAADEASRQLRGEQGQTNIFGEPVGEFAELKATDCCAKILRERGNEPTSALTMARESIRRGYKGKAQGSEDEILLTTAKSFWAALGRDERFIEVRAQVFALKESSFSE